MGLSPAAAADDACYAKFRDPVDKAISLAAQDCRAIQSDEPSDCQRSVGDRCQKSYNELRRIRADICKGFTSSGAFVDSGQHAATVDSQNSAQVANATLNSDNATVSETMASSLRGESTKVSALLKENDAAIRADQCTKSVKYSLLSGRMKALGDKLTGVRSQLETLSVQKKTDAAQATAVATASEQRSQNLSSANPLLTTDNYDDNGNKQKKWVVPALAVGGGLLAIYAILKLKDKGMLSLPTDLSGSPGSSSSGGSIGSQQAPAFQGDPEKFSQESGLRVDPAFSDADKRQIAAALNMFPECQRKFFAGVVVECNKNLRWKSGGGCLPGQNTGMKPPTIQLNPTCYGTVSAALVVHELMHVLANRRDYYGGYQETFDRHGQCAVSPYSEHYKGLNRNEDFAEAGRIAIFPASGLKNSGTCVDNKVKRASELINSCK